MAKKLWVRTNEREYGYSNNKESWKLGTVVGITTLPYAKTDSLQQALEGIKLYDRYLIELENGDVVEAWSWDTYEPAPKETN
jgi:hypothetical protein